MQALRLITSRCERIGWIPRRFLCTVSKHSNLGLCAVIGGNGFLGSNVAQQLNQKGYKVRVLDIQNELNDKNHPNDKSNIEYSKCDITKIDEVYDSLKGVKTIFHCASMIDIRCSPSPLLYDVNVNGTKNILDFCNDINNANEVQNIIYTSTFEVFNVDGDEFKDIKEDEVSYGQKHYNGYGQTKAIAEEMFIQNKSKNKEIKLSAIRLGAIFGINSELLLKGLEAAIEKGPTSIGNDHVKMSGCYVENAAFAHIQIAEALHNDDVDGQVFHYKDLDTSWETLMLRDLYGYNDKEIKKISNNVIYYIAMIMDYKQYIYHKVFNKLTGHPAIGLNILGVTMLGSDHTINTDKFNKIIGYNPPYSVEEAIKKTNSWLDKEKKRLSNQK